MARSYSPTLNLQFDHAAKTCNKNPLNSASARSGPRPARARAPPSQPPGFQALLVGTVGSRRLLLGGLRSRANNGLHGSLRYFFLRVFVSLGVFTATAFEFETSLQSHSRITALQIDCQ